MKAGALTDSTIEMPKAQIVVELPNGQRATATGFVIRENGRGDPIIVIKSGRKTGGY